MTKRKSVVITVRVTKAEAELLRDYADDHDMSVSALVRSLCFRQERTRPSGFVTVGNTISTSALSSRTNRGAYAQWHKAGEET